MVPKVSVIAPMYNVERYPETCFRSIHEQILSDIEIILVDDESPDRCGKIADAYALADTWIKGVHRTNGGLGSMRDSGIKIAAGEYIGFVDSDDWVDAAMYKNLDLAAKKYDADVCCSGLRNASNGKVISEYVHPLVDWTLESLEEIFKL